MFLFSIIFQMIAMNKVRLRQFVLCCACDMSL